MKLSPFVMLSAFFVLNGCSFDFNVAMPIGEVQIGQQSTRSQSLIWTLKRHPTVSNEPDCQEKFNNPEAVYVDSLWLSITHNTLSYDLPGGEIFYEVQPLSQDLFTRMELEQLVQDGALVRIASFGSIFRGENSARLLTIREDLKAQFTQRFLTKTTTIVIATDPLPDNAHMLPGGIRLNLSANVIVTLGSTELRCVRQFPES